MAISSVSQQANTVSDGSTSGIAEFLNKVWETFPYLIVAIVVLVFSVFVAKIARAMAQKALLKSGGHEGASSIVGKTAYGFCLIIGVTISFRILGIDIGFITGAVVFGLGFAMKDIIENYISGVLILLQRPFKIGDTVKAGSVTGKVEEIEARTTFIRIFDGQRVIVPNSKMLSEVVTNFSTYPERRISIEVGVSYDTDLKKANQLLLDLLKVEKGILKKPKPAVFVTNFGDSAVNLQVRFWVDSTLTNFVKKKSKITAAIGAIFAEEGINIPFPITTISVNEQDSDDLYNYLSGQKLEQKKEIKAVKYEKESQAVNEAKKEEAVQAVENSTQTKEELKPVEENPIS